MIQYFIVFALGFAIAILLSYMNMLRGFKKYKEEAKDKLRFYASNLRIAELKYEQLKAMSHTILTPLHGVRGSADNLASTQLNADQLEVVKDISEKANEIFTCLKGVCNFHQNESSQEEITKFHSGTVLLVEDDPLNQKISKAYLEKVGITPDIASTGREAVEAVQKKNYDVVIMDLSMPDMDGIEATRTIRKLPQVDKSLPIIGFTANSSSDCHEACLFAGMNDYLTKPATQQEILHCLQKWMPEAAINENRTHKSAKDVSASVLIDEIQKALESQNFDSLESHSLLLKDFCDSHELNKLSRKAGNLATLAKNKELAGSLKIFFELKDSMQFLERLSQPKKAA